jgi:hypothetical protein
MFTCKKTRGAPTRLAAGVNPTRRATDEPNKPIAGLPGAIHKCDASLGRHFLAHLHLTYDGPQATATVTW